MAAVRPGDLHRPGRGGVSALVAGQPVAVGQDLLFCHQVAVAPAVVRRSGQVLADGWLPGHVTLGVPETHLPEREIEELVEDFACWERWQRLPPPASKYSETVRVIQNSRRSLRCPLADLRRRVGLILIEEGFA